MSYEERDNAIFLFKAEDSASEDSCRHKINTINEFSKIIKKSSLWSSEFYNSFTIDEIFSKSFHSIRNDNDLIFIRQYLDNNNIQYRSDYKIFENIDSCRSYQKIDNTKLEEIESFLLDMLGKSPVVTSNDIRMLEKFSPDKKNIWKKILDSNIFNKIPVSTVTSYINNILVSYDNADEYIDLLLSKVNNFSGYPVCIVNPNLTEEKKKTVLKKTYKQKNMPQYGEYLRNNLKDLNDLDTFIEVTVLENNRVHEKDEGVYKVIQRVLLGTVRDGFSYSESFSEKYTNSDKFLKKYMPYFTKEYSTFDKFDIEYAGGDNRSYWRTPSCCKCADKLYRALTDVMTIEDMIIYSGKNKVLEDICKPGRELLLEATTDTQRELIYQNIIDHCDNAHIQSCNGSRSYYHRTDYLSKSFALFNSLSSTGLSLTSNITGNTENELEFDTVMKTILKNDTLAKYFVSGFTYSEYINSLDLYDINAFSKYSGISLAEIMKAFEKYGNPKLISENFRFLDKDVREFWFATNRNIYETNITTNHYSNNAVPLVFDIIDVYFEHITSKTYIEKYPDLVHDILDFYMTVDNIGNEFESISNIFLMLKNNKTLQKKYLKSIREYADSIIKLSTMAEYNTEIITDNINDFLNSLVCIIDINN